MGTMQSSAMEMLQAHPSPVQMDLNVLAECIQAAMDCHQSCTTCADACLAGPKVEQMRHCIRLNLDCADICVAATNVMSRMTAPDWTMMRAQVESLLQACRSNAAECEKHAEQQKHCAVCAESCRRCERACARMLEAMPRA
jgi:hypothetical protein